MSFAHYAYEILDKLRWVVPIAFGVFYFRKRTFHIREVTIFALISAVIILATIPIYTTLIDCWERSWGTI